MINGFFEIIILFVLIFQMKSALRNKKVNLTENTMIYSNLSKVYINLVILQLTGSNFSTLR